MVRPGVDRVEPPFLLLPLLLAVAPGVHGLGGRVVPPVAAVSVTITDNHAPAIVTPTVEHLAEDAGPETDNGADNGAFEGRIKDPLSGAGPEASTRRTPRRREREEREHYQHPTDDRLHGFLPLSAIGGKRTVLSRATHLRRNSPKIKLHKEHLEHTYYTPNPLKSQSPMVMCNERAFWGKRC